MWRLLVFIVRLATSISAIASLGEIHRMVITMEAPTVKLSAFRMPYVGTEEFMGSLQDGETFFGDTSLGLFAEYSSSNIHGGALNLRAGSIVNITINRKVDLFGMWIANFPTEGFEVTFYDVEQPVQSFTAQNVISEITPAHQTPNDPLRYSAFVNFVCFEQSSCFDKIKIQAVRQALATDNHTVGYRRDWIRVATDKPWIMETAMWDYDKPTVSFTDMNTGLLNQCQRPLVFGDNRSDGTNQVTFNPCDVTTMRDGTKGIRVRENLRLTIEAPRLLEYFGMIASGFTANSKVIFYNGEAKIQVVSGSSIPRESLSQYAYSLSFQCGRPQCRFNKIVVVSSGNVIRTARHTFGFSVSGFRVVPESGGVRETTQSFYRQGIERFDHQRRSNDPIEFSSTFQDSGVIGTYSASYVAQGVSESDLFLVTKATSPTILSLNRTVDYFGMLLTISTGVTVGFYNGNQEIQKFSAEDFTKLLGGGSYNSNPWNGETSADTNFAFINFVCEKQRCRFDRVEIVTTTRVDVYSDDHSIGFYEDQGMGMLAERPGFEGSTLNPRLPYRLINTFNSYQFVGDRKEMSSSTSVNHTSFYIENAPANGGFDKYLLIQVDNPFTLMSAVMLDFFGMWISKLKSGVRVIFYNSGREVGMFSAAEIMKLLSDEAYNVNPNTKVPDPDGARFGFINFICSKPQCRFNVVKIVADTNVHIYTDNHMVGWDTNVESHLSVESPDIQETTMPVYRKAQANFDDITPQYYKDLPITLGRSKFGTTLDITGVEIRDGAAGRLAVTRKGTFTTITANRKLDFFGMWIPNIKTGLQIFFYSYNNRYIRSITATEIIELLSPAHQRSDSTKAAFVNLRCETPFCRFTQIGIAAEEMDDIQFDNLSIGYRETSGLRMAPEAKGAVQTTLFFYRQGTENFESVSNPTGTVTFTSKFQDCGVSGTYSDAYLDEGGPMASGKFLRITKANPMKLELNSAVDYFGMRFSISTGLTVGFYKGDQEIQKFSVEEIVRSLFGENYSVILSSVESGANTNFAFINFLCEKQRCRFDRVEIVVDSRSSVYTDNHSIGSHEGQGLVLFAADPGSKSSQTKRQNKATFSFDQLDTIHYVDGFQASFSDKISLTGDYSTASIADANAIGCDNKYLVTKNGMPTGVQFNRGLDYFAMWISKLKSGARLIFSNGGKEVGVITAAEMVKTLISRPYNVNPNTREHDPDDARFGFIEVSCVKPHCRFDEIEIVADTNVDIYTDNHTVGFEAGYRMRVTAEKPGVKETSVQMHQQGIQNFDALEDPDLPVYRTTTFTFHGATPPVSGTFPFLEIGKGDIHGGSNSENRYVITRKNSMITFRASRLMDHFGMWVSNLSMGPRIFFYNGPHHIQSFKASNFFSLLGDPGYRSGNRYSAFINFICTRPDGRFNTVAIRASSADLYTDNYTISHLYDPDPPEISSCLPLEEELLDPVGEGPF